MSIWARRAIARKKHIITCSGASRHAVIEPCRMAVVVALAQCETLGETQSKTGITRKSCPLYLLAAAMARRNRTPPYGGGESR